MLGSDILTCKICKLTSNMNKLKKENDELKERITILESKDSNLPLITKSGSPTTLSNTNQEIPSTTVKNVPYTIVKNGLKPQQTQEAKPIQTSNKFKILENDDDDKSDIVLIGDSLVRHMDVEFCERKQKRRTRHCFPGAGISKVTKEIDNIFPKSSKSMAVIQVGSNDVEKLNVGQFMDNYIKLIKKLKSKVQEVKIIGILPRRYAGKKFFENAPYLNRKIKDLCHIEKVGFVDFWENFFFQDHLYSRDGVHLNQVGNARLGRLIDEAVQSGNQFKINTSGNENPR